MTDVETEAKAWVREYGLTEYGEGDMIEAYLAGKAAGIKTTTTRLKDAFAKATTLRKPL